MKDNGTISSNKRTALLKKLVAVLASIIILGGAVACNKTDTTTFDGVAIETTMSFSTEEVEITSNEVASTTDDLPEVVEITSNEVASTTDDFPEVVEFPAFMVDEDDFERFSSLPDNAALIVQIPKGTKIYPDSYSKKILLLTTSNQILVVSKSNLEMNSYGHLCGVKIDFNTLEGSIHGFVAIYDVSLYKVSDCKLGIIY